jgi:hypothetical protein
MVRRIEAIDHHAGTARRVDDLAIERGCGVVQPVREPRVAAEVRVVTRLARDIRGRTLVAQKFAQP